MIQERSIKNFTVCILSVQILRLNCDFLQEKLDNIQIFYDLENKADLYQCIRLYRVDLYDNLWDECNKMYDSSNSKMLLSGSV